MEPTTCPSCHFVAQESFFFCPNCGKKIKEPPVSIGIGKQLSIYLISIFFPPFGLWPGITYLLDKNEKAKIIGIVAIVLTILSTIVTTWYTLYKQLNQAMSSQMQVQTLGL
jgi:hypothetical protein